MNNFIMNYASIPNPITKFFNKINYVRLTGNHSKNIEWLEVMKKVPLYVKSIELSSNNTEQLENLTDPNFHNTPINNLWLQLKSFKISSKAIENLKTMHPNLITLLCHPFDRNKNADQVLFGNFTKLLSKLDQTSLQMFYNGDYSNLRLYFSDVIFKIMESLEECSYIRAKSVEIRCRDEDFCKIK